MWICTNCSEQLEDSFDKCWQCGTNREGVADIEFQVVSHAQNELVGNIEEEPLDIILTTTPTLQTHTITQYLGIVAGEALLKAKVSEWLGLLVDGLTARSYFQEIKAKETRQITLRIMSLQALKQGANAIVGVEIDFQTIGGAIIITCSGTAVQAEIKETL